MLLRKFVFAQILFISTQTLAWEFGSRGRNGSDGDAGRGGAWGQDVTIQATGQTLNLNLSGRDGEDGRDGQDGEDASSCHQPRHVEYNVEGASGGDGGDAGQGGDGGQGGNVTVYTNDIKNLSHISVYSEGGRGGRAGRYGSYGRGCRCSESSWRIRKCSKDGNGKEVCEDHTYYCSDGRSGSSGSSKNNGSYGGRGSLTLIPTLNPLPPQNKSAEVSIANILSTSIQLNSHVWENKSGATQLFAPGSIISDTYTQFMGVRSYIYSFGWAARRPVSDFSNAVIYLKADQTEVLSTGSRGFWYDSTIERNGDSYKETFTRAMWGDESTKLILLFSGMQADFAANLEDQAMVSDMLKTSFKIVLKKIRPIIWDKTLFEGVVPSTHVNENNNRFVIRLGQLPGVDPTDLEDGNKIILKLEAFRSFGQGYANTQYMDLKYEIKK